MSIKVRETAAPEAKVVTTKDFPLVCYQNNKPEVRFIAVKSKSGFSQGGATQLILQGLSGNKRTHDMSFTDFTSKFTPIWDAEIVVPTT